MKKIMAAFTMAAALMIIFTACNKLPADPDVSESDTSFPEQSGSLSNTETTPHITSEDSQDTDSFTEPLIQETTASESEPSPVDNNNQIVQTAETLLDIPFAYNGATPEEGFDNSGFIYYVLRENGFINCPRLASDQAAMGTNIGYNELKSGDLAFFCNDNSGNPDFGGIYIGDGKLIYSPMPGETVKIADITSDYWVNAFVTGVSLS